MGGKKRQETTSSLRSSSGRRSQTHNVEAVNVGCMSGIFHLVSKYHTRSKFLTFGKLKAEKQVPTMTWQSDDNDTTNSAAAGRSSMEVLPRSPVIPAEIRNDPSTANSPRLVVRLMGVNESPPASPLAAVASAEKRRKLLGALEKCDEDLKTLKKIIEAVRASHTSPPPRMEVHGGCKKVVVEDLDEREGDPSPVSVLHFSRSPPLTTNSKRALQHGEELKEQNYIEKKERQGITARKLKPAGKEDHTSNLSFLKNGSSLALAIALASSTNSVINITPAVPPNYLINAAIRARPYYNSWSNSVVESVEEVCRDFNYGLRLQVRQIGLLIQDFIFEDLLQEFT